MAEVKEKFGVLFTSDYEIHGNGEGSPHELIVEPTDRMLKLFDKYGAKLTIMADVGEILKFKEYYEETGEDKFHYLQIEEQLQRAVLTGHDVQLHVHSSYFKSFYKDNRWVQHWPEYSMADLDYDRVTEIIKIGKDFLEETIRKVQPAYRCTAFRAANWSMMPSGNLSRALIENDIYIDSSVFKYGQRKGRVTFNYDNAYSELLPWPADRDDVCKVSGDSPLMEIPIYCEQRKIWDFITPNRLFRVFQASFHKHPKSDLPEQESMDSAVPVEGSGFISKISRLLNEKHALKLDFNQCTGSQMIQMLKNIHSKYHHLDTAIPVVSIGHSKIFTKANERSLSKFLKYVNRPDNDCFFATFRDFEMDNYRRLAVAS